MELKKPTTFQEQVKILLSKNIIVENQEECERFLQQVNYYHFSAYYLPFLDKNTDKCFDGTTFEKIRQIYLFDQELRSIIFSIIEDIEIHIRTELAYFHTHKYGPDGYMAAEHYNQRHNHIAFTKHISSCIKENDKTPVVKHHTKKYSGKFPLWVIIEFFSVGMLSHFYRGLETKDKKQIARDLYGTSFDVLESWLRCLTDLRNKCAHYSRLYYWKFSALPKMPKGETYIPTRRLFAQLYMLKLMYPNTGRWNEHHLKKLIKAFNTYKPYISSAHLDFPYYWKSMLKK